MMIGEMLELHPKKNPQHLAGTASDQRLIVESAEAIDKGLKVDFIQSTPFLMRGFYYRCTICRSAFVKRSPGGSCDFGTFLLP